ncbi:MAG: tRNA 4-thiouridine(8) synthase ThiI [Candidatus Aenigmarchaeota archaeon]|nr:tRNA 4-thiouridine(8) synthase ThiI [Candidatus Aenigmarchaeota archaeon]
MRNVIIIKYGELWLKSEPVRRRFIKQLAENIRRMLKAKKIVFKLEKTRDMLILETKSEKAAEVLKRVFGISWFAKAKETKPEMRYIEKVVVKIGKSIKPDQTFAVRASRSDKSFHLSSMNLENRLGSKIKRKVNLSNPDVTIFVEVKISKSYVYPEKIRGLGGLPYGVSGSVLSLISGGIDSPVASWMLMKRGCSVDFIHFCTDNEGMRKVKKIIEKLGQYSPQNLYLHVVPFREMLEGISKYCEQRMTCVLCKRLMYKTSEKFAERVKAKALVTGENLAQVASQTLDNLLANSEVVAIPLLRPLIGMDKEEAISLAKKIGTYGISIRDSEACRFVPEKPATKARSDMIMKEEKRIKNLDKLIKKSIENSESVVV